MFFGSRFVFQDVIGVLGEEEGDVVAPGVGHAVRRLELLAEHQESARLQREIAQALRSLNEKERYVIEHRVTAEEPLTLQEIADHFAISRERVRQIEEGALKKMRSFLAPIVVEAQPA